MAERSRPAGMAGGGRPGGNRDGGGPGRTAAGCAAAARELSVEGLELLGDLDLLGQLAHELAHLRCIEGW